MYYLDRVIETMDEEQRKLALRVKNAPDSFEEKKHYADWYFKNHEANEQLLVEADNEINNFYPDGSINREALLVDIIASNLLYGVSPLEFLQYGFETKTDLARNTYMTDAEKFIMFRDFYDFSRYEYVRNKWLQYSTLTELFGRDCVRCEDYHSEADIEAFSSFVKTHPVFVFKPTRKSCGEGVHIIDSRNDNAVELYRRLVDSGGGIADEMIEQDPRMSKFHTNSVNTIRILGIRNKARHLSYFTQAIMRMGRGTEIIDNNIGAIRSRVDIQSGVAYTLGIDGTGKKYIYHPETKEKIVGFEIPNWDELLQIAETAMSIMEDYARYIGFDFALSTNGWKIVEVNPFPQIYPQQMTTHEGSRPELMHYVKQCEAGSAAG